MKKFLYSVAVVFLSVGLLSCKKGSIEGQVLDPITNKPITNTTVWLKGTPNMIKSPDGSFKFENLKKGEYSLNAGKNKHSESALNVILDEENLDVKQNIYIFSKEVIDPGLYDLNISEENKKIPNRWLNWEVLCKESLFAYRTSYTDQKSKKTFDLPEAVKITEDVNMLYLQAGNVVESINVSSFPLKRANPSAYSDCTEFDKKDRAGFFPEKDKAVELTTAYKSTNLFELKGKLPKGRQALTIMQGDKVVRAYLVDVE
ncbi:MAG: carboxypeptidase-like regulatory domain-containing protein [Fibrobacter sp.]|nr:carboxypeptidase-like regulatory domain-containing protein [Fibrobacter sp.]